MFYRKFILRLKRGNCPIATLEELNIIKEWYLQRENDILNLTQLSELINRDITFISRKAREMELTDMFRPMSKEEKIKMSVFQKDLLSNPDNHPRGFLGKKHNENTKIKMGIASKEYWDKLTDDEIIEMKNKANKTKIKNYKIVNPYGSNCKTYSKGKSGIRNDLNNQYFRSSWEANFARYLNYLNIEWKYEIKRFIFKEEIRGCLSYTPDFYLPKYDIWVEIKGWMTNNAILRLNNFKTYYPEEFNKLILVDEQKYNVLIKLYKDKINFE